MTRSNAHTPASRTGPASSRVRAERRPSDFANPGRTSLACACCCCCCCLHWIGAAIGGAVGIPLAWMAARRRSRKRLHSRATMALLLGMFAGFGLCVVVIVAGAFAIDSRLFIIEQLGSVIVIGAVLVPSVVFAVVGGCMLLSAWIVKAADPRDAQAPFQEDAVHCPRCHFNLAEHIGEFACPACRTPIDYSCSGCKYDLRGSLGSPACPECGTPMKQALMGHGVAYGFAIAWRATWVSFLLASLGTLLGYLAMVLIGVVLSATN